MNIEAVLERTRKVQYETDEAVSKARELALEFILTEISVGLAYAELARVSRTRAHEDDSGRQQAAAKTALETALKFLPTANPTQEQKIRIETGLTKLASALKNLSLRKL